MPGKGRGYPFEAATGKLKKFLDLDTEFFWRDHDAINNQASWNSDLRKAGQDIPFRSFTNLSQLERTGTDIKPYQVFAVGKEIFYVKQACTQIDVNKAYPGAYFSN